MFLYFMVKNLCLQLLDVVCWDGSVLYDTVRFLYQALEVSHLLFVLFVLHHRLLRPNEQLALKVLYIYIYKINNRADDNSCR